MTFQNIFLPNCSVTIGRKSNESLNNKTIEKQKDGVYLAGEGMAIIDMKKNFLTVENNKENNKKLLKILDETYKKIEKEKEIYPIRYF